MVVGLLMKIYLINLDRREDRLQSMRMRLDSLGLDFTRVAAFDGLQYAQTRDDWPFALTPGEVGCFYSHKNCMRLIADGDDEYGVILEDDVELSTNMPGYITSSLWIPAEADIVKLETTHDSVKLSHLKSLDFGNASIGRLMSSHIGAAGYIISKRAACAILTMLEHADIPIDVILFTHDEGVLASMNVYQIVPALCQQSGDFSTINADKIEWYRQRKENYKRPSFLKLIVREVMRPFNRAVKARAIKARAIKAQSLKHQLDDKGCWQVVPFT